MISKFAASGRWALLGALLSVCPAANAVINIDPCLGSSNTTYSPHHPGPSDMLEVRSRVSFQFLQPAGVIVLAKGAVGIDGSVALDIVISDRPSDFPDYQIVNDPVQDIYARVGPLSVGDHPVTTTLRYSTAAAGQSTLCPPKATTIVVGLQSGPTATAPVVEFYNETLDHFFMTQDVNEIAALDNGIFAGWRRTGSTFPAYLPGQSDGRAAPVCRYYGLPSAGLDAHFYSASVDECAVLSGGEWVNSWVLEHRDAFEAALPNTLTGACPPDMVGVYRLWNGRADADHRYVTDPATKHVMVAMGYISEGYGPTQVTLCIPAM